MSSDQEIIRLLSQVLGEVKKLSNLNNLGFVESPRARYIYANRQYNDCLWYFWDSAKNQHIPIEKPALAGRILRVDIEDKEFRSKPDPKLRVTVQADRLYVIQTGLDTLFAQGLIGGLSRLPSFEDPVLIEAEAGETEQVLFCRVYQAGARISSRYEEPPDYRALAIQLGSRLNQSSIPPVPPTASHDDCRGSDSDLEQPLLDPSLRPPIPGKPVISAIDAFKQALQSAQTPEDVKTARRRLEARRNEWGELSGVESVIKRQEEEAIQRIHASVSVAIGQEVGRLGWAPKRAADELYRHYEKRSRSELTYEEAYNFFVFLRGLQID